MCVLFALEFNDTFDLTAIGTIALAVVTVVSLVFGWRSLRLSRAEVEEAHRPVLVPLADDREITLVGRDVPPKIAARPRSSTNLLLVPIENIGTGPALDIVARIELRNPDGGPTAVAPAAASALVGLRADGRVPLRFLLRGLGGQTPGFRVAVTYNDVAGRGWQTEAVYASSNDRYTEAVTRRR